MTNELVSFKGVGGGGVEVLVAEVILDSAS